MGLLTTGGAPLRWGTEEHSKAIPHVSAHGVQQFLNVYNEKKGMTNCPFLWGEEIEAIIYKEENGKVLLLLDAANVMDKLNARKDNHSVWQPEYGSFMVESTPGAPYNTTAEGLAACEKSLRERYKLLEEEAGENAHGITLVTFPLMGVGKFSTATSDESPYSLSLFIPDECINRTHPRFANLTANIRLRRGRKVCIQVPLYIDKYTLEKTVDKRLNIDAHPRNKDIDCGVADEGKRKTKKFGSKEPAREVEVKEEEEHPAAEALTHLYTPATLYYYGQYFKGQQLDNVNKRYNACPCPVPSVSHPCIYMDCMAFGMGSNCLQVTMQLNDINEARHVYDQLAILCPPFLALSSATPFQKGLLCDSDVRWLTIAASVDDRKREEVPRILKSRYDSISVFISPEPSNLDEFNDSHLEICDPYYEFLVKNGVDSRLSTHVAHLFIRDPLVMYDQMIDIDDTTHTTHFENIQSTNWQTVRFKPPPIGSDIGWRVEFRVMDIQPTAFENAAFSVFIALLTRAIVKYKPIFYTKMSVVDENMGRAHRINPCNEKYVMRKDIFAKTYTGQEEETER
ncbi:glutamate--cysteine ligase catalytic subunit [Angomonas deanei]|nr:glutamate--cysteine ligase catalytic subunit [Angomonas deanei]|eukprot:EPY24547.1 glutamate--cysteine ligase catalytic subunit [Angomonas deanei]